MSTDLTSLAHAQHAIRIAIATHGLPLVTIPKGRLFYRVQLSCFMEPLFFNRYSPTRYGDAHQHLGVCYVAGSDFVAVAETLQASQGSGGPVTLADIERRSLHTLATARPLQVVEAALLARNGGQTLDAIVQGSGQGNSGYAYTQRLSSEVMRHPAQVDGLLYPSRAYALSGSLLGCNLVLFEGRSTPLLAVDQVPLLEVELSCGETVLEFLGRLQVPMA